MDGQLLTDLPHQRGFLIGLAAIFLERSELFEQALDHFVVRAKQHVLSNGDAPTAA